MGVFPQCVSFKPKSGTYQLKKEREPIGLPESFFEGALLGSISLEGKWCLVSWGTVFPVLS